MSNRQFVPVPSVYEQVGQHMCLSALEPYRTFLPRRSRRRVRRSTVGQASAGTRRFVGVVAGDYAVVARAASAAAARVIAELPPDERAEAVRAIRHAAGSRNAAIATR